MLRKAARRVNSAGQRRRVERRKKKGWPDSASSSFSLPADGKKPHHLQQKQTHKQSILSFYFFVFGSDFFVLSSFSDLLLLLLLSDLFPFSFFPGRCCFLLRMAVGLLAAETRRRWLRGEETHGSKLGKQRSSSTGKGKLRLRGEDLGSAGAAG